MKWDYYNIEKLEDWRKRAGKEMALNRKRQDIQTRIEKLKQELQKLMQEKGNLATQQAQNE